jgi:hypothetical protein
LKWKVTHWFDPASVENDKWKKIEKNTDPGFLNSTGGALTSEADIKSHVSFSGLNKLTFKFPDSKASYPGKILTRNANGEFIDKGYVIGLTLEVSGIAYSTNFNGMALQGIIWMNTFAGSVDYVGMAGVIAHELGHNMGQAYGDKNADSYFGRPNNKPMPGIPFPKPIPDGDVYGGHGHQGTHCAKGVINKKSSSFQDGISTAFQEHTCVMYGASDMNDSKEFTFCSDCLTYIKAEDLSDIHKSWTK